MFNTSLCQVLKYNSFKCRAFYLRGIAYLVLLPSDVNNGPGINEAFVLSKLHSFVQSEHGDGSH